MSAKGRTFESWQSFAIRYLAHLSRRSDLSVTFSGTVAYTNNRVVNVPTLPAGTVMSPWQELVYGGYLDHEGGHIRWTDFTCLLDRVKDPLGAHLLNLVEDIRMENRHIQEYPGSRLYLDALAKDVDRRSAEELQKEPMTEAQKVIGAIYDHLYSAHRDCDTGYCQHPIDMIPELAPIKKLIDKDLPKATSTKDAKDLAEKIKALLPKNVDYAQKVSEADQLNGLPLLPIGAFVGQGPAGQAALVALIKALEQLDGHENRKKMAVALNEEILEMNNALSNVDDEPSQTYRTATSGSTVLPPVTIAHDRVYVPSHKDMHEYEITRAAAAADITAAKKMLNIFLRSRDLRAWNRGMEEGILDEGALWKVPTGDMRVMKSLRKREMVNTAVELSIDLSGSMSSYITRLTAIMVAEAVSDIPKIKLEIVGWTTNSTNLGFAAGCGRSVGVDIMIYKEFDESYKQARARLGAIKASNYTPLGEAMAAGVARIAGRKEARRILWIVTDGEPFIDQCDRRHDEVLLAQRNYRKAKNLSIEVVGLYIGRQSEPGYQKLKSFCDRIGVVTDKSNLTQAILEITKGIAA